jgi:hypothetical protein
MIREYCNRVLLWAARVIVTGDVFVVAIPRTAPENASLPIGVPACQ